MTTVKKNKINDISDYIVNITKKLSNFGISLIR